MKKRRGVPDQDKGGLWDWGAERCDGWGIMEKMEQVGGLGLRMFCKKKENKEDT